MFETVTAAGYIDRKSKKQESGQIRIILQAGANKTDEDHLLYSLGRNLNLHHQNKIALPITIWCTKDTPFIWGQFMRLVGGFSPSTPMIGSYRLIENILSEEGFTRFQAYLEKHPEMNER